MKGLGLLMSGALMQVLLYDLIGSVISVDAISPLLTSRRLSGGNIRQAGTACMAQSLSFAKLASLRPQGLLFSRSCARLSPVAWAV